MTPVAAGIGEQPGKFFHAGTRRRVRARRHAFGIAGESILPTAVRQGPQIAGSEAAKITTTGRPKAAAMWAGPESLPMNREAEASRDFNFGEARGLRAKGAERGEVVGWARR